MLKLCKIGACPNGTLGLHLSRAPWDPYPWVSGVQDGSSAYRAGVRIGDTVLELNGTDILGQKIFELASKIRGHWESGASYVSFLIWRNKADQNVVKPPGWQCCNGHVLCNSCRGRTVKCPICRVTLGPRGRCLLSDKLFTLLAETFPCDDTKQQNDTGRLLPDRRASAPAKIRSPKGTADDKQIISIKVDFKSPQQDTDPVWNKNYQCPTGKSCGGQQDDNETCKMFSQWDVLTHLRRTHQLSVVQYYGTYGEQIQVEFMNKSIPCICIASVRLPTNASLTPHNVSSIPLNSPQVVMPGGLLKPTDGLEKMQGVDLFFVARVPIGDGSAIPVSPVSPGNEGCAIFIWHCGSESNVKKFRAVIECKRSATKWTGCIHPLTMSWNSVQRRREFLQLKFDVADFLDIVIKIK